MTERDGLKRELHHIDPEVRWIAIQNVENLSGPEYTDLLVEALGDHEYESIRWRAAVALGDRGDPRAVSALIEVTGDKNYHVREAVIEALGKIRDVHAIPALITALHDPVRSVRLRAIRSLERMGEPAENALRTALQEEHMSSHEAVLQALQEIEESKKTKS